MTQGSRLKLVQATNTDEQVEPQNLQVSSKSHFQADFYHTVCLVGRLAGCIFEGVSLCPIRLIVPTVYMYDVQLRQCVVCSRALHFHLLNSMQCIGENKAKTILLTTVTLGAEACCCCSHLSPVLLCQLGFS